MIRTPGRGVAIAGVALSSLGLAVGVIGPVTEASAQSAPVAASVSASAPLSATARQQLGSARASVSEQAAAVAALAGATATNPPKPKPKPKPRAALAKHQTPHQIGLALVKARGWSYAQYTCLDKLWTRESDWKIHESNGSSGAYGIPQSLPGRKMAAFGRDWRDNPKTQIKWGLWYIADRYGTPCKAWAHSQQHNWY